MARTVVTVAIVILSLLHQGLSQDVIISNLRVPEYVKRFTNVTLECVYESSETPIFITWSHNDLEFLKFQPKDADPITIFADNYLTVIEEETTAEKVTLKEVDLNASGNYTCKVMGESPNFHEDKMTKTMTVVGIPDDAPSIEGDVRDHYAVGDNVNLTCTTPPSVPAATLTWHINDHKAPAKYLHEYEPEQSKEGLFVSRLRLNFQLAQSHFISGELRLKCVASMVAFYHETNEHSQQAPTKAEEPPVKEVRNLPEEGSLVTTGTSGSTSVWTSPPFTLMLYAVLITAAHLLY